MKLFRKIEDGVEIRFDQGSLVAALVGVALTLALVFLMGMLVGRTIWGNPTRPDSRAFSTRAEGSEPLKPVDMTFYGESSAKPTKIEPPAEFVARWEEKKAQEAAAQAALEAARAESVKLEEEAAAKKEEEEGEKGKPGTAKKPGETPKPAAAATKPAVPEAKPAAAPKPPAPPPAPAPAPKGSYTVQINSFKDKSLAERMSKTLAENGIRAEIVAAGGAYKVTSGSFSSKEEAQRFRDSLEKKGVKGFVAPR